MKVYYIHQGTEQSGPFSIEELRQKNISKDTPVWYDDLPEWKKAGELPELNSLFISVPPPFIEKEPVSAIPVEGKKVPPPLAQNKPVVIAGKKNMTVYIILFAVIVAAAVIYFFTRSGGDEKKEEITKDIMAPAKSDSAEKKEIVNTDTTKRIDLDTLSNWMNTDTVATNTSGEMSSEDGFSMGGIPIKSAKKDQAKNNNTKPKRTQGTSQPEQKKPESKSTSSTETTTPAPVRPKTLLITGSFRKNLLLESILEGRVENPNNNISFRNIMIVVHFIGSDGESVGTKQFAQSGTLRGGESVSFKFKATAPKGSKTARYSVSASGF